MSNTIPVSLHTASLNGIPIFQVGKSELSSTNKKDQRAELDKGENKSIDLGKGVQNIRITIKVNTTNDFTAIYNILKNDRKGTLTDRFLGTVKVSISNFQIIATDKELGLTTIKIAMVIDEDFTPTPSYIGAMDGAKGSLAGAL